MAFPAPTVSSGFVVIEETIRADGLNLQLTGITMSGGVLLKLVGLYKGQISCSMVFVSGAVITSTAATQTNALS